jgi:hypothetical protein
MKNYPSLKDFLEIVDYPAKMRRRRIARSIVFILLLLVAIVGGGVWYILPMIVR